MTKLYALLVIIILFISLPRFALAEENILFQDSFSDGSLNNWTIESGNWTEINGFLRGTKSGRAILGSLYTGESAWDNYKLEIDVFNARGIDEGIGFRYTAGGDAYLLNLRHGEGIFDTPQLVLRKTQGGTIFELANIKPTELKNNKWYKVTIEVLNENIKIYINGEKYIDIEDPDTLVKKGTVALIYWTGDISIIDVRFDNLSVTSLNPKFPEITPVLLIPGIGGSELQTKNVVSWSKEDGHGGIFTHEYPEKDKVWVNEVQAALPGEDDYFDVLKMKPDGITPEAELKLTGNLFSGAYQPAIDFLTSNGYELNESLFIFPYDWRMDLSDTTLKLDQRIEEIKSQTNSQQVDIISHSMGGLLARKYISEPQKAGNVRKLIELGVPHLGSVDSLKHIKDGGCLRFTFGPLCLDINPTEVNDVVQNMVSVFQLLPTQLYSTFYVGSDNNYPLPFKDEADIDNNGVTGNLNYSEIKSLLTNLGHNTSLFTPAENFHNSIDLENVNGVNTTIITGSGIPTLGQIIEKNVFSLGGIKINKKDALFINGDKTVPLYSSSLDDPDRGISLKGEAKVFYTKEEHGSLVGSGPAMNLVKNILEGSEDIPENVSNQPTPLNGTLVSVHSPVDLDIYDSLNNHTGFTLSGDLEENIPGSFIEILEDAKFIWLPENGLYKVKINSIGEGSFDLKIKKYENSEFLNTIIFKDIPVNQSTKASMDLDTLSSSPLLLLDKEGDGNFEENIIPLGTLLGNEADTTPPEVEIFFNTQDKKFEINGFDDNGNTVLLSEAKTSKLFKDILDNSTKINFNSSGKLMVSNLSLNSISYNESNIVLPKNNFLTITIYNPKKKKLFISTQNIDIEGKSVSAIYNDITDKTILSIKEPNKKTVIKTIKGQIVLKLKTNKGDLEISY